MKNNEVEEIISTYDEYIKLLEEEINSVMGLAIAHGYTGNETGYQQGIALREKISNLKETIEKDNSDELYTMLMLMHMEYINLKGNLMDLIDNANEIKLLSFFPYPSCVRNVILSTNHNFKTAEQDWMIKFAERMLEVELPKYNMRNDNKIAIEFEIIQYDKNGNQKNGAKVTPLIFGSRDGEYYIGLSGENIDGFNPIKMSLKE